MPSVNFYLKKPEAGAKLSLIILKMNYKGVSFVYGFGQKVDPANWNKAKQRVKTNKITSADGQHSLNELLDALEAICLKAFNEEIKNGIPPKEVIKRRLDAFFVQNLDEDQKDQPTLFKLIDRFISGEIRNRGKDKSQATLNNYKSARRHLEAYSLKRKVKLDFETITLDFFHDYTAFLKKFKISKDPESTQTLSQNSIAKDIRVLKVFMGEAVDLGYTNNQEFRRSKFSVDSVEVDSVYLTEKEVMKLYEHDFSGNLKLEAVRDLFVVGCFTGLRYSDYSTIKPENIVRQDGDLFIKMITQKTKELVIIPCNTVILQIFKKYQSNQNRLPRSLSNQKFNDYIKEACQIAGLTEAGRLSTDPALELWEKVSSHTARRSFATNLYLEGFPTIDLMKITGHRTEKAFLKYIRVSKLDTAKRLNEHMKRTWSSKLLKVAI